MLSLTRFCLRYGFLARAVTTSFQLGPIALAPLQRMAMDQLLFAPSYLPVFVGGLFLLEGRAGDVVGTVTGADSLPFKTVVVVLYHGDSPREFPADSPVYCSSCIGSPI